MSDNITFRSIAAAYPRNQKIGVLSTDDHGYCSMVVGAIGTFNSKGEYYESSQEVQNLFKTSSLLQLQIRENSLYGENGHPSLVGMTEQQAFNRFMSIYEPNVCTHFRAIDLDPDYYKHSDTLKKGEIAIVAQLKPYGDKAQIVTEAMSNPYMNLSYSIRCVTKPKQVGNIMHRIIKSIITFDKVYMPGISHASKRNAALHTESFILSELDKAELTLDIEQVAGFVESMQAHPSEYSTESVMLAKGMFKELQQHLDSTNVQYGRVESISNMFKTW